MLIASFSRKFEFIQTDMMSSLAGMAPTLALVLVYISVPLMLLFLLIFYVSAQRRSAAAEEQIAKAQTELVKQVVSIAIELRYFGQTKQTLPNRAE